ncbi:STAS domain-containing protein [Streptomyces sp. NPDC057757]|uniref:STAS domain-containing protein n=1 Tax=Streptomyces sp. NPDC057757 TaxID=3346241 RepID=UPI003680509A
MTDIEQADRPESLFVQHSLVDGVRVVIVRGAIDHTVKGVLYEALLPEDGAVAPVRIVVDFSGVTFMDSSGINVLLDTHQRVSPAQGWLRIAGAQESVVRVLHILGIDEIISCHPSIEQALNA